VYAVTVAKGGPKLTMNTSNPGGNPGHGGGLSSHSSVLFVCGQMELVILENRDGYESNVNSPHFDRYCV